MELFLDEKPLLHRREKPQSSRIRILRSLIRWLMNERMHTAHALQFLEARAGNSRAKSESGRVLSMLPTDLLEKILRLPAEERASFALKILKSLDSEHDEGSPKEIETAWDTEIEQRLAEVRAGTAQTISCEEHEALMDQIWAARAKR